MISQDIVKQLTNCRVFSTVSQDEDEEGWLKARTHGLGGSDVGAICGVSPFSSAKQVYFSKTGQYEDSFKPNEAAKERMHFGHMLEPVVADEYVRRTGNKVVDIQCTLQHNEHPWALANVDRLILNEDGTIKGILECKTTSEYMNDEWDSGEILESYIYQLNWYLWILGLEYGAFACLVGGNKFYTYEVYRNDELLNDTIVPTVKNFWFNNVLKLVEPEMQATDTDVAKELYGDCVKGSEVIFEDEVTDDLVTTIQDCKAKIKELKKIQEEAENRIKDRMKEKEIAQTRNYTVKWSPQTQRRIDSEVLKVNYPDIYDKVCKTINFRVMRIKGGLD